MSGNASQLNPNALPVELAARILSTAGKRAISAETIRGDIDVGAPVNADGTINLVNYAAWLLREETSHAD